MTVSGINLLEVISRVKDGLGFRTGTNLDSKITLRVNEAIRDLERGKTLPKFLLLENMTLTLALGAHTATLAGDFLRDTDDVPLHYTPTGTSKPFFLKRVHRYVDAVEANIKPDNPPTGPKVYVIRKDTVDFITTADKAYSLTWDYYVNSVTIYNNSNEWFVNAPEWLIGEVGLRIAKDLRDKDAVALFTEMRTAGRAAWFGDGVALEESGAQYALGADL